MIDDSSYLVAFPLQPNKMPYALVPRAAAEAERARRGKALLQMYLLAFLLGAVSASSLTAVNGAENDLEVPEVTSARSAAALASDAPAVESPSSPRDRHGRSPSRLRGTLAASENTRLAATSEERAAGRGASIAENHVVIKAYDNEEGNKHDDTNQAALAVDVDARSASKTTKSGKTTRTAKQEQDMMLMRREQDQHEKQTSEIDGVTALPMPAGSSAITKKSKEELELASQATRAEAARAEVDDENADPLQQLIDDFGLIESLGRNVVDEEWEVEAASGSEAESEILTSLLQQRKIAWKPRKPLWPFDGRDYLTFLLASFGLLVAACGGIGGGPFFVPLYIMVLGFPTANASALSNVTIFGGSIANLLFNCRKKTASGDSVIDWNIILLMEPSTILGAVVGTLINKILPSFVLQLLLVGILLLMGVNTLEKGMKRMEQERPLPEDVEEAGRTTPTAAPAVASGATSSRSSPAAAGSVGGEGGEQRAPSGGGQGSGSVWKKFFAFLPLYVIGLALQIMRGDGHKFQPVANCGTLGYWLVILANFPVILLSLVFYRRQILNEIYTRRYLFSSPRFAPMGPGAGARATFPNSGDGFKTNAGSDSLLSSVATTATRTRSKDSNDVALGATNTTPFLKEPDLVQDSGVVAVLGEVLAPRPSGSDTATTINTTPAFGTSSARRAFPDTPSATTTAADGGRTSSHSSTRTSWSTSTVVSPSQSHGTQEPASAAAGNIEWNAKNTVTYPAICTCAGVMAGMFGIGGGVVKGPLMLALGVEPQIASATAATMIFFTASTACVSFALFGFLALDYAAFAFVMGFVFTMVGQASVAKLFQKRQAPIILSMACVILISTIAVAFEATEHFRYGHDLLRFHSLCDVA
mmetsp:Transcript_20796/g.52389  ORF Transcript_20796/g.52389 Transcript_20796/m.52389 type:complete len:875 (-) Transcript_20796:656-3280(-)